MSINEKDVKILWYKSAGRCAFPGCRMELSTQSQSSQSCATVIGENCHIVGENETSARFKSILTTEERNRYPNLILLCRNHHREIDGDELKWPIECLHQIKADHEIWVQSALTEAIDTNSVWYTNLINAITEKLNLLSWDWFSDNAIRGIVADNFIDGVGDIDLYLFKAIYPGKYPDLENTIKNLIKRAREYVNHFTSNSKLDQHGFHRGINFHKRIYPNPRYHEELIEYRRWEVKCSRLFFNLTHALNEYAETVRKYIKPDYFKLQGKFTIMDNMGVLNRGDSASYLPDNYFADNILDQLPEDNE